MAIIFDVVTLNRTPAGQTLLHTQLCPLLADERATKVTLDSFEVLRMYYCLQFFVEGDLCQSPRERTREGGCTFTHAIQRFRSTKAGSTLWSFPLHPLH